MELQGVLLQAPRLWPPPIKGHDPSTTTISTEDGKADDGEQMTIACFGAMLEPAPEVTYGSKQGMLDTD
ncbi:uncharacterized protein PG986_002815 [Apiospora aurea]|uniref:Pheromone n=1 Tax=Apiospora aurea TaxID=335848 RepID=A0ABR1QQ33_9PEZI